MSNGPHYVPDGALLHAHFNAKHEVVDYLLYNMQFEVARDTKTFLEFHNVEELTQKINKRDLYFKMNDAASGLNDKKENLSKNKI